MECMVRRRYGKSKKGEKGKRKIKKEINTNIRSNQRNFKNSNHITRKFKLNQVSVE
jgi:hypothetical protein